MKPCYHRDFGRIGFNEVPKTTATSTQTLVNSCAEELLYLHVPCPALRVIPPALSEACKDKQFFHNDRRPHQEWNWITRKAELAWDLAWMANDSIRTQLPGPEKPTPAILQSYSAVPLRFTGGPAASRCHIRQITATEHTLSRERPSLTSRPLNPHLSQRRTTDRSLRAGFRSVQPGPTAHPRLPFLAER